MNSSASDRIVITGSGAVCGAGIGTAAIWDAIQGGRSAIRPISGWDTARWPVRHAAEVEADNRTLVSDRKLHKMISRTDLFGLCAGDQAVAQSGLIEYRQGLPESETARFNDRTGILAGSGGGAYRSHYDYFPLMTVAGGELQKFGQELGNTVNPMWLLKNLPNNVLCHLGIRHNFKGTNGCITNQCAGSVLAVTEAAAAIRYGEADRAVAVGHDAPLEPETVFHYHDLGLMARDTVRPFDAERRGTLFGEGAGAVVLERESAARARGATVLGAFLGAGCTTEATGIVDVRPDGDGVVRAIELALADAAITPEQVGMIVAHGNGTPGSDASEAAAFRRVFGDGIPPITGFKWAVGHLIAASGILDFVLALEALRHRSVPGIGTLSRVDPHLAPLPVSSAPQVPRSDIALVVCRGFGGMNVVLVLRAAG